MLTETQKQPELEFVSADLQVGDITVDGEIPELEYMYGCTVTVMGMLLGYYDLYGYQGYDLSDVIDGNVALDSRGSDGDIYNKNEFDSVLGKATATQGHVDRFFGQSAANEKKYTYIDGKVANGLNIDAWDCLADYLGTNQYWRGNGDLSTSHYFCDLAWLKSTGQTYYVSGENIPAKYVDYKYGLELYVQSKGYDLDDKLTYTEKVDTAGGSFTFKDYMAEIDAGRPVLISIVGHSMIGYGYNADTQEIIFDDTYRQNQRMKWGGTYKYSGENRALRAITVIAFETGDLQQVQYLEAPQVVASTTKLTNQNVILAVTFNKNAVEKEYSFDGKTYYKCSGTLSVAANGTVYFRSKAANGRYSEVAAYTVNNIDKTAPVKPVIKLSTATWSYDPVTVTAVFSGDSAEKLYSFDNKNWQDYTGTITVDRNRTLYFRASDALGNTVSSSYTVSNIIALPPTQAPVLSGSAQKNKVSWTWKKVTANPLSVTYQVKINGKTVAVSGTSYQISNAAPGSYSLSVRAVYTASGVPTKYSAWATKSLRILDSTAPKISKLAATVKGYSATLKITASDNVKVAKYVISYGKKSQTVTSNTATLTGLGVGKVAVSVVAYDAAGNKSAAKKINLTVKDSTPPSKVTTLYAPSVTNKYKGTFKWTAATDNSGKIAKYEIQLDNGKIYTSTKTSVSISNLKVGNHTYRVRAIDKDKNVGAWSAVKSFTVKDYTAPKISKLTATVKGYTATLKITATDNVKATKYVISYGKKSQTVTTNTATLTGLAVGRVAVSVVAYDAAGNKSTAKKINLTVKDVTPPSKVTTLYAPTVTNKYKGTFKWAAATDNSGKIAKYEIQLDNGKIYTSTKTTLSVSNLKVGNHTYRVRAIDKNKNAGAWSAVKSFTVKDMTAPATVSLSAKVSGNNATLTWKKPKDNVGVTKYVLKYGNKSVTFSGSATKYVIYGLNKGTYSYSMIAYDAAGNASKAKTGKITIKQPLAPARAAEALYAADFAAPEALFAPQTDILAYCNDLQSGAVIASTDDLTSAEQNKDKFMQLA